LNFHCEELTKLTFCALSLCSDEGLMLKNVSFATASWWKFDPYHLVILPNFSVLVPHSRYTMVSLETNLSFIQIDKSTKFLVTLPELMIGLVQSLCE